MMKITVLIDNRLQSGPGIHDTDSVLPESGTALQSEHGLSFYIETDAGMHILCDTGASGQFIENARKLGIDLSRTDLVFLSHGHNDHTGGLRAFLEQYPDIPVYLESSIFSTSYFSNRIHKDTGHTVGKLRDISTDSAIPEDFPDSSFHLVKESCWITPEIAIVTHLQGERHSPAGNSHLYCIPRPAPQTDRELSSDSSIAEGQLCPDDFSHEMALVIKEGDHIDILSSCSHCGAPNIMEACMKFTGCQKVRTFIGGLHLVLHDRTDEETDRLTDEVAARWPDTEFITGHCTCDKAIARLEAASETFRHFYTGLTIDL